MLNFSGAVIELAMDSGVIQAGRRTRIISELELELKAGQPAQLFELALALQEIVPVEVEAVSKAEYGYRLCDRMQPAVARAEIPVLPRDATLAQALQGMILGSLMSEKGGRKMGSVTGRMDQKDLASLGELIEAGKIRPVIDRCYPFSQTAEALRYLGAGHARGKVVITVTE
jgi:hypothetical protein